MHQDHGSNTEDIPIYFQRNRQRSAWALLASPYFAPVKTGRIRFFRIGTRVLYSDEHLTEFLEELRTEQSNTKQLRILTLQIKVQRLEVY